MIKKILFISFCLGVLYASVNAENETLKIGNLLKKYTIKGQISFNLVNEGNLNTRYIVGVEKRNLICWKEFIPDVEAIDLNKVAKIRYAILPKGKKEIIWPTKNTPIFYLPQKGKFRLVVTFVADPNKTYLKSHFDKTKNAMVYNDEIFVYEKIYSEEFSID